jgi:hypothetical protein
MTDIFDCNGRIVADLDEQVSPERRLQYGALVAAQVLCDEAEADEKSANEAVAELVKAHDRAHAAVPRETFMDLWRQSRG